MGTQPATTRRQVLKVAGALPAAAFVAACGSGSSSSPTSAGGSASAASGATGTTGAWASGGTDLITVNYPKTAIFNDADACRADLTGEAVEGPCYFKVDTGEDITEGRTGVPMQLCAQLIDEQCNPLEGYTFEVWQCDVRGIYSGDSAGSTDADRFDASFCTNDDAEALDSNYLRGQRTTDAEGRVNFSSVFPGWYAGRVIHIHFAISDPSGSRRLMSQWVFPDTLCDEICTTHELYSGRGAQDTPLARDGLVPSDGGNQLLATRRNKDGTMLAYGKVQIA